jgi:transposase
LKTKLVVSGPEHVARGAAGELPPGDDSSGVDESDSDDQFDEGGHGKASFIALTNRVLRFCQCSPEAASRRVLNGIFWVLRSGAPWRDLPETDGPCTAYYNRFVRWRRAGVSDRIMAALTAAHDAAVQMIDTSVVRVHQHGACIAGKREQHMGRSRGGLTSKVHAVVDANGLPVRLDLTPGEAHDNRLCPLLLAGLRPRTMVPADRGYDAPWIRAFVNQQGAWANIPPKRNRKDPICFSPISTGRATWRAVLQ